MYMAVVNKKYHIQAGSLANLKRSASRVANRETRVIDTMEVTEDNPNGVLKGGSATFQRINKKSPDGTIQRGSWS